MKYFDHDLPIHPSSMTRWRNRIGEAGSEELLKETIEAGSKLKAIKTCQMKRAKGCIRKHRTYLVRVIRRDRKGSKLEL